MNRRDFLLLRSPGGLRTVEVSCGIGIEYM
jgi:hypothetical protein